MNMILVHTTDQGIVTLKMGDAVFAGFRTEEDAWAWLSNYMRENAKGAELGKEAARILAEEANHRLRLAMAALMEEPDRVPS